MADAPSRSDSGDDSDGAYDRVATTGTPRWVKAFAIAALVVIVLFVILMVVGAPGSGGHGPGRHMSSAHRSGRMLSSSVNE